MSGLLQRLAQRERQAPQRRFQPAGTSLFESSNLEPTPEPIETLEPSRAPVRPADLHESAPEARTTPRASSGAAQDALGDLRYTLDELARRRDSTGFRGDAIPTPDRGEHPAEGRAASPPIVPPLKSPKPLPQPGQPSSAPLRLDAATQPAESAPATPPPQQPRPDAGRETADVPEAPPYRVADPHALWERLFATLEGRRPAPEAPADADTRSASPPAAAPAPAAGGEAVESRREPTPPPIQISIGTIEIRATPPPAAAKPAPRRTAARTSSSLEAYYRRRMEELS
jgi:hypothetical protein